MKRTKNSEVKFRPYQTIFYNDPLNDDFASNNIVTKPLRANFKYDNKNIFYRIGSWCLYFLVAIPILNTYNFFKRHKVENRKVIRKLKKQGFVVYMNHVTDLDPLYLMGFILGYHHRRAYVIAGLDAFSIKGVSWIVKGLGGLPVPENYQNAKDLKHKIKDVLEDKNQVLCVYPEEHIWPYFTGIRPFKATSFRYSVDHNVPAVPIVTVFESRKKWNKKPKPRFIICEPIYPDMSIENRSERSQKLRDDVYNQMVKVSSSYPNDEYIRYIKRTTPKAKQTDALIKDSQQ